jgi:hypothetical protein
MLRLITGQMASSSKLQKPQKKQAKSAPPKAAAIQGLLDYEGVSNVP